MNDFCVLIRDAENLYGEIPVLQKLGIKYREYRSEIPFSSLVLGRYSVIPYYKELEADLANNGSRLINTYQQYRYVADLGNWYRDLEQVTPKTWFSLEEYLNDSYEGPVVLKGETNSRRDKWLTHMFANNKNEAREVYCRLLDDSLISQQKIYIRKYEKLKKLIDGVNGMPIPNEWRVFVLYGCVISRDYYWSTYLEDIKELNIEPKAPPMAKIVHYMNMIGSNSNFYSMDIVQKEDGDWIVIELNEGQMSGLNGANTEQFYLNLKKIYESTQER